MNKQYLIGVILLFQLFLKAEFSFGQFDQVLNSYSYAPAIYNPAFYGIEQSEVAIAGYRKQWASLESGPTSFYGHFNTGISLDVKQRKSKAVNKRAMLRAAGRNTRTFSQRQTSWIPPIGLRSNKWGIGTSLWQQASGPLSKVNLVLGLAYHLQIDENLCASFGLNSGFSYWRLTRSSVVLADPNDPAFSKQSHLTPALGIGGTVYTNKWYLGINTQQILPYTIDFGGGMGNSNQLYATVSGAKSFFVVTDLVITPALIVNTNFGRLWYGKVNARFAYQDLINLTLGFDKQGSFNYGASLNLNRSINIGYQFEAVTSSEFGLFGNSHDITLSFNQPNRLSHLFR